MTTAERNKWMKYLYLRNYQPLAPYVPETRLLTSDAFWGLLAKYEHVILKPVKGSRGRGVIQVSSIGNDKYALHHEKMKITLQGKERTYKFILRKVGSVRYMVQRRVSRPTVGGRPFDLRVIIQRKRKSGEWRVTGKVAKVAGRGYIVSNNSRSKGTLLQVKTALRRSSVKHLSAKQLLASIKRVSLLTAQRLSDYFPDHHTYGLDIGWDQNGHTWIIEANLFPAMSHFLKLKDKTMYRRIMAYKKASKASSSEGE